MSTFSQSKGTLFGIFTFAALGFFAEFAHAQQAHFAYPPYGAQRGRMVYRDGLFHSERYRWGNGLTPQGAAFLTHAVDAFAPVVMAVAGGRDIEDDSRSTRSNNSRSVRTLADSEDYVRAQNEANELLRRTEVLVLGSIPPKTGQQPAGFAPKLTREQVQQQFGNNPWKE